VEMKNETQKTVYKVWNCYGIRGESTHKTAKAALKEASKREGDGWMVTDSDGDRWVLNGDTPVCIGQ
jgi:hypothetical protein